MPLRWTSCLFRPARGPATSLDVNPLVCPAELHDQLSTRGTACLRPRGAHIMYERVDDAGQGAFTPPVLIYVKRLHVSGGLDVCIKRTLVTHFIGRAIREARLQVQLNHPHLLPALASVRGRHHFYLVLPAAEGDLWAEAQVLRQQGTGYSEDELRDVARQMLMGLEQLHSGQLAHRDIKPANILRLPDGRVVVADFGCADGCTAGFVAAGTTQFQPPECRRQASTQLAVLPKGYDQRSQDMWSVGATLASLWFALLPEVTRGHGGGGGGCGGGSGSGRSSRKNSRGAAAAGAGASMVLGGQGRGDGGFEAALALEDGRGMQPPKPPRRRSSSNIATPSSTAPFMALSLPRCASVAEAAALAGEQASAAATATTAAMTTESSPAAKGRDVGPTAAAAGATQVPVPVSVPPSLPPLPKPPAPPPPAPLLATASQRTQQQAQQQQQQQQGAESSSWRQVPGPHALPRFLAAAGFASCRSTVGAAGSRMSTELLDLLSGCLQSRPADRITAAQALQHPWLAGANGGRGSGGATAATTPSMSTAAAASAGVKAVAAATAAMSASGAAQSMPMTPQRHPLQPFPLPLPPSLLPLPPLSVSPSSDASSSSSATSPMGHQRTGPHRHHQTSADGSSSSRFPVGLPGPPFALSLMQQLMAHRCSAPGIDPGMLQEPAGGTIPSRLASGGPTPEGAWGPPGGPQGCCGGHGGLDGAEGRRAPAAGSCCAGHGSAAQSAEMCGGTCEEGRACRQAQRDGEDVARVDSYTGSATGSQQPARQQQQQSLPSPSASTSTSSPSSPWLRPSGLPPPQPLKLPPGTRKAVLRVFVGAGSEASGSS